jgi:nucleoside-diphosphate-sugar epimerase
VLRLASESNVKKFVFSSSAGLYGTYPKYVPIDENHPVEIANSVYNVTKRIGEDMCNSFAEKHGVPVTILRLFTTFGPRQSKDYFFPTLILQALKNKEVALWNDKPTRDFNFVANTVDAFVKAAESHFVGGPINIGSGNEINVGEIAKRVANDFNVKLSFMNKEVVGPMRLHCNNKKAKEILGWEPMINFEDGLKATIEWYKNNHRNF